MDLSISDSELNDRCHAADVCQASALRDSLRAAPAGATVLVSARTDVLSGSTDAHWVWLWPGGGMVLRRQESLHDDIRVTKSVIGPAAASALRERLEALSLSDFLPRRLSYPQIHDWAPHRFALCDGARAHGIEVPHDMGRADREKVDAIFALIGAAEEAGGDTVCRRAGFRYEMELAFERLPEHEKAARRRAEAEMLERLRRRDEWYNTVYGDRTRWQRAGRCPRCGFTYRWDGRVCDHCKLGGPPRPAGV